MTDEQIQRKLDKLVELCRELDKEAKRRYGEKEGNLFYESYEQGGVFCIRDTDTTDEEKYAAVDKTQYVTFMSEGMCPMKCETW